MPRKKKTTAPRRSRQGYIMIEMSRDHKIALNWLLARKEKLLGEKQKAAPFIRSLIWMTFVNDGGLEELSGNPFSGLDSVKTEPYT